MDTLNRKANCPEIIASISDKVMQIKGQQNLIGLIILRDSFFAIEDKVLAAC